MRTLLRTITCLISLSLTIVTAHADELKIVAAENFYGGVAKQLAGSGATVTTILSNPNQDPHEFTTNATTARAVADADIVIYSGIGYDTWMEKLLGTRGKPDRIVICVAALIGAREGDNPHIWYDPQTMPALADKLAAILAGRDPANGEAYRQRAEDFKNSMKPVLEKIGAIKSAYQGTPVTATEPVFGYMAHALGFTMMNDAFQVNVMNDTEPSADQTAAFEKSLTSRSVKILFYNSQVADPTTERMQKLAVKSGVPIVGATETQPPDQASYVAWMLNELHGVEIALGIKTP